MRTKLLEIAASKKVVSVFFPAAGAGKLVSASGTVTEVGDDFFILADIYGNSMLVPFASMSFIELKK